MKIIFKIAAFLIFFSVSLNSYAAENELYGRWIQTVTEQGIMATNTYDFTPDGVVKINSIVQSASPKVEVVSDASANYTYKNKTITFKCKAEDINITKMEIEGLDPAFVGMAIEQQKQQMAAQQYELKDVKINGNILTAKEDKIEITLIKVE